MAASPEPDRRVWRGRLVLSLKAAIAAALVVWLVRGESLSADLPARMADAPGRAGLVVLVLLLPLPLVAWRWRMLLGVVGVRLPFAFVCRLVAIGVFSGVFLPGGVGGDVVRLFYVAKAAPGRGVTAAATLLIDRLLGLGGLLVVALGVFVWQMAAGSLPPILQQYGLAVLVVTVAGLAAVAGLMLFLGRSALAGVPEATGRLGRLRGLFAAAAKDVALFRHALPTLAGGMVISIMGQAFTIAAVIVTASIFAAQGVGALDYALATPLAILANQVPLTPGGLGVGEGAFAQICRLLAPDGQAPFATIFLTFRGFGLIAALIGGIAWLTRDRQVPMSGSE